jgi:hypothetical protein
VRSIGAFACIEVASIQTNGVYDDDYERERAIKLIALTIKDPRVSPTSA